jgi:hypothetical protein
MIEIFEGEDATTNRVCRLPGETDHRAGVAWIESNYGRVYEPRQTPLGQIGMFDTATDGTTAWHVETSNRDVFLVVVSLPQ